MEVQVYTPRTVEEVLSLLKDENNCLVAGGTNFMVDRKKGKWQGKNIISLDYLNSLRYIKEEENGILIGSLTTFQDIENIKIMSNWFHSMKQAAANVGGPQIRNAGTIGGNIISASPAADLVPVLMTLDAKLKLVSAVGERIVPITEFMKSPGRTNISHDELLVEILLPKHSGTSVFYKVGKRNALAISIVNLAIVLHNDVSIIKNIAIALGSVGPVALRAYKTEQFLQGLSVHENMDEVLQQATNILITEISPITDIRATEQYRRTVAGRLFIHNMKTLLGEHL